MGGLETLFGYILLGAFAGTLAGLLGVGGGLIIVPALVWLWQTNGLGGSQQMSLAIGTSLASIVLTSLSSTYAHHRRGGVRWDLFQRLTPGILLGAWIGAALATRLPDDTLRSVFGLFELLVAAQMAIAARPPVQRRLPGTPGMGLAGTIIGTVSAVIGIGGGTLTVPFLTRCNVHMQHAVATSAACGLPIAIGGALAYVVLGWDAPTQPPGALGFIYLPALLGIALASVLFAPLGTALAHRLSTETLRQVFALFLGLLGVWMLVG